jgi:predicted CoA-binding protein
MSTKARLQMSKSTSQIAFFRNSKFFAIAGASKNRNKIGNRVVFWYKKNMTDNSIHENKLLFPVNPKEKEIEGIPCISSLNSLPHPKLTSISIITPPSITIKLLEEGERLGIKHFWLQPGSEDEACLSFARDHELDVIAGGPCILISGSSSLAKSKL